MLAMCPGPVNAARLSLALPPPSAEVLALVDADGPELRGCRTVPLEVGSASVRWLGAIARGEAQTARRIVLTVREDREAVTGVEAERPVAGVEPRRLIPGTQLLPLPPPRLFGSPERARVEQGPLEFTLACEAGAQPAGAVFPLGNPSPGAALALDLDASGDDGFRAQVIAADEVATDTGLALTGSEDRRSGRLPVPAAASVSLVASCPPAAGRLRVSGGALISTRAVAFERPAAWMWSAARWRDQSAELLTAAQKLGLGTIYISVPIAAGEVVEPDRLADFVARAKAAAIDIVAVEGDPDMIAGRGRAEAIARARALAAYQAAVPVASRLGGLQYDIEPYLLGGFAVDPAAIWQSWGDTLRQLAAAFGSRVDAVIPYWIMASGGGSAALSRAASSLRRITVMAYRTAPQAIIAAAEPTLAWADDHAVPALVALEAGPLPSERRDSYVPAVVGELHLIPLGPVAAAVLFKEARAGPQGRVFRYSHAVRIDTRRISFDGNTALMTRVAAGISPDLAAWSSMRGLAFHGLTELDPLAAGSPLVVQENVP